MLQGILLYRFGAADISHINEAHLLKNVVLSVGLMSVVRLWLMLSSDSQTPSRLVVLQIIGQSGQCWVPSEPQPVMVTNSIL